MFIGPQFQINYTSHLFSKHQLGVYEKTRSPAARGNSSTWTDTWGGSTWERATAGSRQKRKLWRTRRRKELDLNHGTEGRILARMVGGCDCNRPWIRRKKFMPQRSKRKSRKKRMKGRMRCHHKRGSQSGNRNGFWKMRIGTRVPSSSNQSQCVNKK